MIAGDTPPGYRTGGNRAAWLLWERWMQGSRFFLSLIFHGPGLERGGQGSPALMVLCTAMRLGEGWSRYPGKEVPSVLYSTQS